MGGGGTIIVGRDAEVASVRRALDRARAGHATVVVVAGAPGIGKTALWRAALDGHGGSNGDDVLVLAAGDDTRVLTATGADPLVLAATGDEAESGLAFGVVDQLLRRARLDAWDLADLAAGPGADPVQVGAALLTLIDRVQLVRPLVVVVDDAQWADEPSLRALAFAMRRVQDDRVLLCLVGRDDPCSHLPAGLVRLADDAGLRIELGPLDRAAVGELAKHAYGRPVPPGTAARLHELAGGNPLHTRALLDDLPFEAVAAGDLSSLPVPRSYASLVLARVAGCGEEARALVAALAVLGSSAAVADAARVAGPTALLAAGDGSGAGVGPAAGDGSGAGERRVHRGVLAAVEELVASGLVEVRAGTTGTVVAFPHGLVRSSILADLSPSRRAALHTAAAAVTDGDEALGHRLAAAVGPDAELVAAACRRADAHLAAGAPAAAARHLLAAAPLAATPAERQHLVVVAAAHLAQAGAPVDALVDEIAGFPDGALRSYVLGRSALTAGDPAAAQRLLVDAWERAAAAGGVRGVHGDAGERPAVAGGNDGDGDARVGGDAHVGGGNGGDARAAGGNGGNGGSGGNHGDTGKRAPAVRDDANAGGGNAGDAGERPAAAGSNYGDGDARVGGDARAGGGDYRDGDARVGGDAHAGGGNAGDAEEQAAAVHDAARGGGDHDAGDVRGGDDVRRVAGPAADLLAVLALHRRRGDEVVTWARRALVAGNPSGVSATLLCHGFAIDGRFADADAEMTAILAAGPPPTLALDARLGRGVVRVWANDLEGAETDLTAVDAGIAAAGSLLARVDVRSFRAEVAFRAGRWQEALGLAQSTASVVDDAGDPMLVALPHAVAAFVLSGLGRLPEAQRHADTAAANAAATGLVPARIWSAHAALRLAASRGDHAEVVRLGDGIVAEGFDTIPEGVHHWRATYVEALVALDLVDRAAAASAELTDVACQHGDVSVTGDAARAAGVVAAAQGRRAAAGRAFADGLALDPGATRPFERARLEMAAGAHLRRAGNRRRAAELLATASARFHALGATPWAARCAQETAACGLTPRRRVSAHDQARALTARERLVARLVAGGRTNREVAAELVISAKTVEHHLGRVYAKLGVRSRTELATRLAADPHLGGGGA
ncbi:MAG TPA: AAA family ATPase [Acidimicrobiales bacterium]|nr:AAA family ATPase [Acidimicrobiales bacterium]